MKSKIKYEPFDWQSLTPSPVIGVDEVGRGCLVGRVYAAAVVLPAGFSLAGVTDSKLVSENRREELSREICAVAKVGIGFADVHEIEQLNILWAAILAMKRAVEALGLAYGHVIVDGTYKVKDLPIFDGKKGFRQTPLIKGDLRALPVAAASIVAKVARDQTMRELDARYPQYAFARNKGYGSEEHRRSLREFGPCPEHRKSFAGVREFFT